MATAATPQIFGSKISFNSLIRLRASDPPLVLGSILKRETAGWPFEPGFGLTGGISDSFGCKLRRRKVVANLPMSDYHPVMRLP